MHQTMHGALAALVIDQERRRGFVPVPRIVPVILMRRDELAGLHLEGDHRVRIQVVAVARISHPRPGVAGTPVGEAERRVVRAGDPDGHAAGFPGIARPRFIARFAFARNGVGLPRRLTGLRIERGDETADAHFATRNAHHDHALRGERCHGRVVTVSVILNLLFPNDFARARIERDQERIDGRHVHAVAIQRYAAIGRMQLHKVFRQLALIAPQLLAAAGVERDDIVLRRGDEHDAVIHHGWRLMSFAQARRERPHRHQVPGVRRGDLVERAVAMRVVVAAKQQPIACFWIQEPRVCDGAVRVCRRGI